MPPPRSSPSSRCRSATIALRHPGGTSMSRTGSARCRPSCSTTRGGSRCSLPAGPGAIVLSADCRDPNDAAIQAAIELWGPHQRSGGALRQLWRKLRLRGTETAPLQPSMRRAVEHRALMAIAIGDAGAANTSTIGVATLDRGWTMYAHHPIRGIPLEECAQTTPVEHVWESLRTLHDCQISHGDLRGNEITVDDGG